MAALQRLLIGGAALAAAAPGARAQFVGFGPSNGAYAGYYPLHVEGGDVSGDGIPDIVTLNYNGDVTASVSAGDGVIAASVNLLAPIADPLDFRLADVDGDGDTDILRISDPSDVELRVYRNQGGLQFTLSSVLRGFGASARSEIRVGDLNGDGRPDAYVVTSTGVGVSLNQGNGQFAAPVKLNLPGFIGVELAVGDLDGDGRDDAVAMSDNRTLRVLLSTGAALAEHQSASVTDDPDDVELADIDDDGDLDVLVSSSGGGGQIDVFRNDGLGNLSFQYSIPMPYAYEIEIADLDGDGDPDIVSSTYSGAYYARVLLNDGFGFFNEWPTLYTFPGGRQDFALVNYVPASGPELVGVDYGNGGSNLGIRINQTPDTAPAAFALRSPPDGAQGLALPEHVDAWAGRVRPLLEWERAAGFGVSYTVRIARDAAFTDVVFSASGITDRVAAVDPGVLAPDTTYHWRVEAVNSSGATIAADGHRTFTTAEGPWTGAASDFDRNGVVNVNDLLGFLGAFRNGS